MAIDLKKMREILERAFKEYNISPESMDRIETILLEGMKILEKEKKRHLSQAEMRAQVDNTKHYLINLLNLTRIGT